MSFCLRAALPSNKYRTFRKLKRHCVADYCRESRLVSRRYSGKSVYYRKGGKWYRIATFLLVVYDFVGSFFRDFQVYLCNWFTFLTKNIRVLWGDEMFRCFVDRVEKFLTEWMAIFRARSLSTRNGIIV